MITIKNLKKRFGKLTVLNDVDLKIERSRITAIVGPNSAGKSTLIKSILGLVKPDSGDIFVEENRLNGDWRYRKDIGYMPQIAQYPENLKVREILDMLKDLRQTSDALDESLIEAFGLESEMNKPFGALSGGTRQKVSAVIAFIFNPQILILDEPSAGLDPVSSLKLKQKILAKKQEGKTLILTTHLMAEVEAMAENIVLLMDGRVLFQGDAEALRKASGRYDLEEAIANLLEKEAAA